MFSHVSWRSILDLLELNFTIFLFYLFRRYFCFSQDGRTALMVAANEGHRDVVELLLVREAKIEAADQVIRRLTFTSFVP